MHDILSNANKNNGLDRKRALRDGRLYVADSAKKQQRFFNDLGRLSKDFKLILWRAWADTKARYKRSVLGPYWLSIGTLTFVIGYSILAGLLFRRPLSEFLGYIACGVVTWQFISGSLGEGSRVFISNAHEITSISVNLLSLPFKQILRGLIAMLHSLPIVFLVVFFTDSFTLYSLMIFPGVVILSLTMFGLITGLGTLTARYRDLEQLTTMLVQFSFYMTPILWKVEMLGKGVGLLLVYLNPFYYLLSILRLPLMGKPVEWQVWAGAVFLMCCSLSFGLGIYARFRQRIPFWI
ncbi:ABC transporter permease [Hirschia maritima]|uniref:ABC transporter permease n=1 Tax=Hirschia maritima TaxID=1121961 RepID=UPI0003816F7D|nr:ABC transporter permease [Hirschia maritima]